MNIEIKSLINDTDGIYVDTGKDSESIKLIIKGLGEFFCKGYDKFGGIENSNITKIAGYNGKFEKVTFTMPAVSSNATSVQAQIRIYLDGANDAEYSVNAMLKSRLISFEFNKGASPTENAANFVKAFNNTFIRDRFLTVTSSGAVVTIEGTTENQKFADSITLEEFIPRPDKSEYTGDLKRLPITITVVNRHILGFGTTKFLEQTFFDPNNDNMGKLSTNAHRKPVPGVLYTLYQFNSISISNTKGDSILNQQSISTTPISLWVNGGIVTAFEAAIKPTLLTINGVAQPTE